MLTREQMEEVGAYLCEGGLRDTSFNVMETDAAHRQRVAELERELAIVKCGEALCGHDHSTQYWELRANNAEAQLAQVTKERGARIQALEAALKGETPKLSSCGHYDCNEADCYGQ